MEMKKDVIKYRYILQECIDNEISAPTFFDTLFNAQEVLAKRVAETFDADEKTVLKQIVDDKDDDTFNYAIYSNLQVAGTHDEISYSWLISEIPNMYEIVEHFT